MYKQRTTFYQALQNCKGLDLRDNRGKRHNLVLVLFGLILGLLRNRDGNLSSIHRSMINKHEELIKFLGIEYQGVVSRSHLPILLSKVNLIAFEELIFTHYGLQLSQAQKSWFAGDGKELRGSISKGNKRGDVIVQLVSHENREVLDEKFYNGRKESEKPCLQALIKESGASNQKITADALHLCPAMTELIESNGGTFLIGLKGNQKELLEDMQDSERFLTPVNQMVSIEKGHGRIENRSYFHYDITGQYVDKRWNKSNFQSLFKVNRITTEVKTGKVSNDIDYYISNANTDCDDDFFAAIRKHWAVEVNNHIRDVTLKEDKLRTKKTLQEKLLL